jgi:hypothetical protein
VRWWNGVSWSDVATPAGPGVVVQTSPELAPRPGPAEYPPVHVEGATPHQGVRAGWVVAIALVLLVAVVGGGLLVGRSGSEDAAEAAPTTTPSAPSTGSEFPPGTTRIIDDFAGISYPYLGTGWSEWDMGEQYETDRVAGQYFTTQEVTPDYSRFIAQCTSGPLAVDFGWAGPDTLRATTATLAESVRANYYPGPNELRVMRDEARTVDGRAAHLVEFQLSWQVPGYDATGERAALLLIDVGRPAPALLYISIPNTHAELYGVIDQVIDAVDVL